MVLPLPPASEHRHPADSLVYPVFSRRSGGLSLGIELFPEGKECSFDCPYCEVLPSKGGLPFSIPRLEAELEDFVEAYAKQSSGGGGPSLPPVRDICVSGSGEPSLSPFLGEALASASRFRAAHPGLLSGAKLVLITNSTGFQRPELSSLLADCAASDGLDIWAKLDAGSQPWFEAMSGTKLSLESIVAGLEAFAAATPIAIQTMVCRLGKRSPDEAELAAYSGILSRLGAAGARVREVQLYTQARPAPGGLSSALTDAELVGIAQRVISASPFPLRVFGSDGEIEV